MAEMRGMIEALNQQTRDMMSQTVQALTANQQAMTTQMIQHMASQQEASDRRTAQMIQQIFAAQGQAQASRAPVDGERTAHHLGRRRALPIRDVMANMTSFSRGEGEWKRYAGMIVLRVGAACTTLRRIMERIVREPHEVGLDDVVDIAAAEGEEVSGDDLAGLSVELWELLAWTTDGEAKAMLDAMTSNDGFRAWHRLHLRFNPRTFGRALRLVRAATNPRQEKDTGVLVQRIEEHDRAWADFQRDIGGQYPDEMRVGILHSMCPPEVRTFIEQMDGGTYETVKQRILTWVHNRVASVPVPMDIGEVEREEAELDVGAVSWRTRCYTCQGMGHLSRDCPSARLGGKGGGGGKGGVGKGTDKDQNKDKVPNQEGKKGAGKSFNGDCFNCGKRGHRAAECRAPRRVGAVDEEGDSTPSETVEVGTVWAVGAVDVETMETVETVETARRGAVETVEINKVEIQNGRDKREMFGESIEVTLDSGAGASCWPMGWLPEIPTEPPEKGVRFKTANGGEMAYHGTKTVHFRPEGNGDMCSLKFHVTDASKPLVSAAAVARLGNKVVMEGGGGYIFNPGTGSRIDLKLKGGVYVFNINAEPGFSRRG